MCKTISPATRWICRALLLLPLTLSGGVGKAQGWSVQDGRLLRGGQAWNATGYYPGLHSLTFKEEVQGFGITNYTDFIDLLANNEIDLLRLVLTYHMAIEGYDTNGPSMSGGVVEIDLHFPYLRNPSDTVGTWHSRDPSVNPFGLDLPLAGHQKFNLTTFDESFFTYWDGVVSYAESQGVVIQVVLFETHHLDSGTTDGELPMQAFHHVYNFFGSGNNTNQISLGSDPVGNWFADDPGDCATNPNQIYCYQLAYVTKAVETLCHHENVIWEIANEPAANQEDWISRMASQVTAVEGATPDCAAHNHLIMGPEGAGLDLPEHRDVPGHRTPGAEESVAHYQAMRDAIAAKFHDPKDGRPMIADNDCCFSPGTAELQRKKAWTALVAGAYPSLFDYTMELEDPADPGPTLESRLQFVGATALFLDQFGVDLLGMAPDDVRIAAQGTTLAWLLSREGVSPLSEGIVYFFDGGSAQLSDLPASFSATWFDPSDGSTETASSSAGLFTTPTAADWVLYVVDAASSCAPPPSGDWVVNVSCTFDGIATAPANVLVQGNAALTIAGGAQLDIDLSSRHLKVKAGSKVIVKAGGKIH